MRGAGGIVWQNDCMASSPRASADSRFGDDRAAAIGPIIEPTVAAHGLYLDELILTSSAARTVLKVAVDYESGTDNVDLDTLAGLSEALSVVLDSHQGEPLDSLTNYELEVTTPGATRPLTETRHFKRSIGRLLEIDRHGGPPLTGRLNSVDENGITVTEIRPGPKKGMKPKVGPETHVEFGSISRARVQVEFSHTDQ